MTIGMDIYYIAEHYLCFSRPIFMLGKTTLTVPCICSVIFLQYMFEIWAFDWPLSALQFACKKTIFSTHYIFSSVEQWHNQKAWVSLRPSEKRLSIL